MEKNKDIFWFVNNSEKWGYYLDSTYSEIKKEDKVC